MPLLMNRIALPFFFIEEISKSPSPETKTRCNGKPASVSPIACIFTKGEAASMAFHHAMISEYVGDSVLSLCSNFVTGNFCANDKKEHKKKAMQQASRMKLRLGIKIKKRPIRTPYNMRF